MTDAAVAADAQDTAEAFAPGRAGWVYALFRDGECIYVGASCRLSRRIAIHRRRFGRDFLVLMIGSNDGFLDQKAWIELLKPSHNVALHTSRRWASEGQKERHHSVLARARSLSALFTAQQIIEAGFDSYARRPTQGTPR